MAVAAKTVAEPCFLAVPYFVLQRLGSGLLGVARYWVGNGLETKLGVATRPSVCFTCGVVVSLRLVFEPLVFCCSGMERAERVKVKELAKAVGMCSCSVVHVHGVCVALSQCPRWVT